MKRIKKTIILALALFVSSAGISQETAQSNFQKNTSNSLPVALGTNYNTAIGLRAGETSGLTIKHFIGANTAIEGILGFWHHGFHATVLLEKHVSAFGAPGLNWYYGGGGHIAFHTNYKYYGYGKRRGDYYDPGNFGLGVDGIVGLEFKIPEVPIAMSLDFKPYIEIISNGRVWAGLDPGLGIKVAF